MRLLVRRETNIVVRRMLPGGVWKRMIGGEDILYVEG